jgi:hypothetical protein
MECEWNDINGRLKYLEKNVFHGHFVRHRFHKEWSGLNLGLHGERLITNHMAVQVFR